MMLSTPNSPSPTPSPTSVVPRMLATASTPTFTVTKATTRSRRRCLAKHHHECGDRDEVCGDEEEPVHMVLRR